MSQFHTVEKYSGTIFRGIYGYATLLGVISCRLDKDNLRVHRVQRHGKWVTRILRFLLTIAYNSVVTRLFIDFKKSGIANNGSFIGIFAILQMSSVMIFAIFVFGVQTRCEGQVIQVLNEYMRLYQCIMERCRHPMNSHGMLNRKFLAIFLLKFITTLIGYVNEIPAMLHGDILEDGPVYFLTVLCGIYLWLGSTFVLDLLVLGLLIIAIMYEEMGEFLRRLLTRMSAREDIEVGKIGSSTSTQGRKRRSCNHRLMKMLCECSDVITDCDTIYADLYTLTKQFQHLFQWHIFYYIYFNFMVILLMFHNNILIYLHEDYIDKLGLLMVAIKIVNLAILIMCADRVVQMSQIPQLLCLDVICSDIDERWCMSVESFLSRRQTERLEIQVLGFFQLNNEFILLILSAIVSYLFIIIQFGLAGIK